MKREDLEKLGLTAEQVDKVMAENGKDIEKYKTSATTSQTELDSLKKQLTDANAAIEGFKKLDVDGIKAAADEWKTKAEQAAADAQKQVAALEFNHALDAALAGAKAKNGKAVRALLNADLLKLADDGTISGLKEQLEKIQSENDYLFESETPAPKIVAGGQSKTVIGDAVILAARRAAGLPTE